MTPTDFLSFEMQTDLPTSVLSRYNTCTCVLISRWARNDLPFFGGAIGVLPYHPVGWPHVAHRIFILVHQGELGPGFCGSPATGLG